MSGTPELIAQRMDLRRANRRLDLSGVLEPYWSLEWPRRRCMRELERKWPPRPCARCLHLHRSPEHPCGGQNASYRRLLYFLVLPIAHRVNIPSQRASSASTAARVCHSNFQISTMKSSRVISRSQNIRGAPQPYAIVLFLDRLKEDSTLRETHAFRTRHIQLRAHEPVRLRLVSRPMPT
ncbi:hypothetical protein FA95DRAFT_1313633 [Auriscalpium vulgare]|uniref:Uncharacterized protein n=1 Tax=Auriscalpium vulgare TaxID=40419 RepID=A0ACB8R287_9AGAM|nr:hypothetical protein FA95DRAFT_1313633 [Auriscalpium vulgare]